MSSSWWFRSALIVPVLCAACGGGGGYSPTSPSTPTTSSTPVTPYAPGTPAATNEVVASSSSAFNPSSLTVAKGAAVTFTFEGVQHNVTFDNVAGAPADIGNSSSTSVQRVFATAGTFGYQCTIHSGMRGTVVVN